MKVILDALSEIWNHKATPDDDFADRLSHRYSALIFIILAFVVGTKQYVGDAIQCRVPAQFSDNHMEYANSYCWIRNTYHVHIEDDVPKRYELDRDYVPYYQWVPLVLLIQAFMFYIPRMMWRSLNNRSGIDVGNVVTSGETFQDALLSESREKTLIFMTKQMHRYLTTTNAGQEYDNKLGLACCGRKKGKKEYQPGGFLVILYCVIKLCYLLNVVGQFFLVHSFIGNQFMFYGYEVVRDLIQGGDWLEVPRFPRVTICDFDVRVLGNIHRYTVQCVLPINLFNEKIYLLVWFWLVAVAIITFFSLLVWFLRCAITVDRHRFVKGHLKVKRKLDQRRSREEAPQFVARYLRQDGCFVLRMLEHNTNPTIVTEFVCTLWDHWQSHKLNYASTLSEERLNDLN